MILFNERLVHPPIGTQFVFVGQYKAFHFFLHSCLHIRFTDVRSFGGPYSQVPLYC